MDVSPLAGFDPGAMNVGHFNCKRSWNGNKTKTNNQDDINSEVDLCVELNK